MGFFDKLFGGLFGKRGPKGASPQPTSQYYMTEMEKERQQQIQAAELRLKDWIIALVNEKGSLPFTWESGSDEAFVTFADRTEAQEDNFDDLEQYIVDKLSIPDAGEFNMTGSGTVYIQDNFVRAKYSSSMKAIVDYDEQTDEAIYGEEEQNSGDEVLFSV